MLSYLTDFCEVYNFRTSPMEMAFWSHFCQFFFVLLFTSVCAEASDQHEIKDFLKIHQEERERRFPGTPVFTHCPNGYIRHDDSCYRLAHANVSWPDALVYCEAFGGHLAYIESEREQHFLTGFLATATVEAAHYSWIGGSDAVTEGEWFWVPSLEPIKYTNWSPGEPNNGFDGQDCIGLYKTGLWDDGRCDYHTHFLCEIELNTDVNQFVG